MNYRGLKDLRTVAVFSMFALALLAFAVALSSLDVALPNPTVSPEVGVKEYSPLGLRGGAVVPASCPSYAHTPGECDPPPPPPPPPPPQPPTVTGSCCSNAPSNPLTVNANTPVTINWSCVNSSSSQGVNFSTGGAPSGSVQVTPGTSTTYTVVCSNGGSGSLPVTVLNPTLSLTATPAKVKSGSATQLVWSASSVDPNSCVLKNTTANPAITIANGNSGSQVVTVTAETNFTLSCSTDGGPVSVTVTVGILPSFVPF